MNESIIEIIIMLVAALKSLGSKLHHVYPHWTYTDQFEKRASETTPEVDLHKEVGAEAGEWFKLQGMVVSMWALMCVCSSNCCAASPVGWDKTNPHHSVLLWLSWVSRFTAFEQTSVSPAVAIGPWHLRIPSNGINFCFQHRNVMRNS